MRLLILFALVSLNATPPVFAFNIDEIDPYSDGGAGVAPVEHTVNDDPTKGGTSGIKKCDPRSHNDDVISLGLFNTASKIDRISYDLEIAEDGTAKEGSGVRLGSYVTACFKPRMRTKRVGNKVFVMIVNDYFNPTHNPKLDNKVSDAIDKLEAERKEKEGSDYEIKTNEKYEACLEAKGFAKRNEKTGNLEFDGKKIREGFHFVTGKFFPFTTDIEGEPLSGMNKDETYQLYFASNDVTSDYYKGKTTGIKQSSTVAGGTPGWECVTYAPITIEDKPLHLGAKDALRKEVVSACNKKEPAIILKKLSKLEKSSVGNAGKLAESLDAVFIKTLASKQDEIMENNKGEYGSISNIEAEMQKLLKNVGNENADGDAVEVAKEYNKIMTRLDSEVYAPAIARLKKLHEGYYELSKEEQEQRDIQIKELTHILSRFFAKGKKRRPTKCSDNTICKFFREYYINDLDSEDFIEYATKFESLRLKSAAWGRACKKRKSCPKEIRRSGNKLSPRRAERKINKGLARFDKQTDMWVEDSRAKNGDRSILAQYQRGLRVDRKGTQRILSSDPYKGLGWCKYSNTKSCLKKKAARQHAMRKRVASINRKLNRRAQRLQQLTGYVEEYREKVMEEDNYDPFADDYEYYDSFNFGNNLNFNSGNNYQPGTVPPTGGLPNNWGNGWNNLGNNGGWESWRYDNNSYNYGPRPGEGGYGPGPQQNYQGNPYGGGNRQPTNYYPFGVEPQLGR